MNLPLLVVVLGPTASGKTSLALHLAERLHGEIVSCDSVAVYREFEIGTAKPSLEERQRVPHHLIDIAGPADRSQPGTIHVWRDRQFVTSQRAAACRLLPAVPDSICALFWKGYSQGRRGQTNCAPGFVSARRNADRSICINSCAA